VTEPAHRHGGLARIPAQRFAKSEADCRHNARAQRRWLCLSWAAASLLSPRAQAQQWDGGCSDTLPMVSKVPAAKASSEDASTFDAKFGAALTSNNIFRGYTLSNNLPNLSGNVEASYAIFFTDLNGASVQIPQLSQFHLSSTTGLRPKFGALTLEAGCVWSEIKSAIGAGNAAK
jgi:hypothetical protein